MISEVSISNYKSILYQQFSLGRVNVFVGPDDSGKTNILEAVAMAAAAHDDTLGVESLLSRGIRAMKPSLTFHSSPGQEQGKAIEIEWQEKRSRKKAMLICENPDETDALWKDVSWYEPEYIGKVNELIKFIGDGITKEQYPFADESKNAVLNAAFRGSRNFRDYTIYNINASDLKELPDTPEKILSAFSEEQKKEIDCSLPVLFYLSLFFDRRSPCAFAIDNIENLLAPDVCSSMMQIISQLASKNNKQVFITTSNPAFANGLTPEQKLFLVKMTENGQTVVEELKDKTLVEI